ncbi:MAG TPA: ATPase domain-containing protein [Planctomycetota bacterium]|nr:ATPase domain-containing protein [Planctomycetota bacterium]
MNGGWKEGIVDESQPDRRRRVTTGISGVDEVLGGGLLPGGVYLLSGGPGTGKTVFANQFCFAAAREGRRAIYVTMLAESHSRMIRNLESFEYFRPDLLQHGVAYISAVHLIHDQGLETLLELIKEEVIRREASALALDGLRMGAEIAAASHAEHTMFLDRLAAFLEFSNCTGLVSTLSEPGIILPEHALADGLFELRHKKVGRRSVREFMVCKLRGCSALAGGHLFEIDERGMVLYPRTEARLARCVQVPGETGERQRFGIDRLDDMLHGGLPSGSTTALIGPTGAGKTLLGLHFLAEGARRGERGLYFGFYESPDRVTAQGDGVGLNLSDLRRDGALEIIWHRPFEHLIDRIMGELLERARQTGARRLFIDGAEGLARGAAFPERLPTILAAVTNELRARGISTLLSIEGQLMGHSIVPEHVWSALVENVIVLRYVELQSHLRRLIWIVKVRESDFESSLREFSISRGGIQVAETFESAEAILSGIARVDHRRDELERGDRP